MAKISSSRWSVTDFSAGVASDPHDPADRPLSVATGVDIHSDQTGARLARAFSPVSGSLLDAGVTKILALPTLPDTFNPYLLAFLENGKIWRFRADGTGFSLVWTDPDGPIANAFLLNGRLYWITGNRVNNIPLSAVTGVSATPWNPTEINAGDFLRRTLATGSTIHPVACVGDQLFIGDVGAVAMLDTAANSFNAQYIKVGQYETVVGLTYNGSMLAIYTTTTGSATASYKYLWSGQSVSRTALGTPIAQAFPAASGDLFVSGFGGALRLSRGVGYGSRVLQRLEPTVLRSGFVRPASMVLHGGSLLFCGEQDGLIRQYGSTDADAPEAYSCPYVFAGGTYAPMVTAVETLGDGVYAGVTVPGSVASYAIHMRSSSACLLSGTIATAHVGSDDLFRRKVLESLRVACVVPEGTNLAVGLSFDGGAFSDVRIIGPADRSPVRIEPSECGGRTDFVTCRVRVMLSSSDPSVSPVLRGIELVFSTLDRDPIR